MSKSRNVRRIRKAFDRDILGATCTRLEADFQAAYDMTRVAVPQRAPDDFYLFKSHGSNVLAVAHLDTVGADDERAAHFIQTEKAGEVVYSRALDDRLGAYIILEWLPALGIQYDILLTVGEESGMSTAQYFEPDEGVHYDWIIEFDRGGTDVVMYQYDDDDTSYRVERSGARVGEGIFSDISYMEHLQIKAFNWGVGYRDYHGPRAHAYLEDTYMMLGYYLDFHRANKDTYMPHRYVPTKASDYGWWDSSSVGRRDPWYDDDQPMHKGEPIDDGDYDGIYRESEYFEREYIDQPTLKELEAMEVELDRQYIDRLMRES